MKTHEKQKPSLERAYVMESGWTQMQGKLSSGVSSGEH